ncbi:MAG: class I SAM-dependent methyltransferase [Lachnospiraceae bacterium]|nr:class I SAM-dependent methyltransferase [Lachnospiraceae bacterium]
MEQKSMTALISAFSRAYHSQSNEITIFDDSMAKLLLSEAEYAQIAKSMANGVKFFNPSFSGNEDEALRWIVDNQLSPSPLGRAAYAEKMLKNAVNIGTMQYLIFAAGYDTFACRQPSWANKIQIFEIDHPLVIKDKMARLERNDIPATDKVHYVSADFTKDMWQKALLDEPAFCRDKVSFCSLLGLSYYLSKQDFSEMLLIIGGLLPKGSALVFDYPDQDTYTDKAGERTKKQLLLAKEAKESMLAGYSYKDIENILEKAGFLIYEHLEPDEITRQYFYEYNASNPNHKIIAFDNVNYCLAVKK